MGRVGLWKYVGREALPYEHVAVKNALGFGNYLDEEAAMHWQLDQAASNHILALVKEPLATKAGSGLHEDTISHIRNLLMEYCHLGDLQSLLDRRIKM